MTRRLRAVIADDEPLARARLSRLLGQDGGVDIVAECEDGAGAVAAIRRHRPDVAFLDVRMPGMDGLQVASDPAFATDTSIVYITAYAEYAVRAFDAAAADYLLKPLSPQRLQRALERVRDRLASPSVRSWPERLPLRVGARMRLLPVARIQALQACANYIEVHGIGKPQLVRETLSGIESRLDPARFVRIHRSRIVRIDAVHDVEALSNGRYLLRLSGGLRLSSGRNYRTQVRNALGLPD